MIYWPFIYFQAIWCTDPLSRLKDLKVLIFWQFLRLGRRCLVARPEILVSTAARLRDNYCFSCFYLSGQEAPHKSRFIKTKASVCLIDTYTQKAAQKRMDINRPATNWPLFFPRHGWRRDFAAESSFWNTFCILFAPRPLCCLSDLDFECIAHSKSRRSSILSPMYKTTSLLCYNMKQQYIYRSMRPTEYGFPWRGHRI